MLTGIQRVALSAFAAALLALGVPLLAQDKSTRNGVMSEPVDGGIYSFNPASTLTLGLNHSASLAAETEKFEANISISIESEINPHPTTYHLAEAAQAPSTQLISQVLGRPEAVGNPTQQASLRALQSYESGPGPDPNGLIDPQDLESGPGPDPNGKITTSTLAAGPGPDPNGRPGSFTLAGGPGPDPNGLVEPRDPDSGPGPDPNGRSASFTLAGGPGPDPNGLIPAGEYGRDGEPDSRNRKIPVSMKSFPSAA